MEPNRNTYLFDSFMSKRPFRRLDSRGVKTWERVSHFHGGELYAEVFLLIVLII